MNDECALVWSQNRGQSLSAQGRGASGHAHALEPQLAQNAAPVEGAPQLEQAAVTGTDKPPPIGLAPPPGMTTYGVPTFCAVACAARLLRQYRHIAEMTRTATATPMYVPMSEAASEQENDE